MVNGLKTTEQLYWNVEGLRMARQPLQWLLLLGSLQPLELWYLLVLIMFNLLNHNMENIIGMMLCNFIRTAHAPE